MMHAVCGRKPQIQLSGHHELKEGTWEETQAFLFEG